MPSDWYSARALVAGEWIPAILVLLELSHLFPPRILHGTAGVDRWRDEFFLGKFIVRKGPGFVQVRDHR